MTYNYKDAADTLKYLLPESRHTNKHVQAAIELCERMARCELVERTEVGRIAAACAAFDEASR